MKAFLIGLVVIAILVFVVLRLFGRKWAGTAEKESPSARGWSGGRIFRGGKKTL